MRQILNNFHSIGIVVFFVFAIFGLSSCKEAIEAGENKKGFENVSMIRLVSNPDKYSGKVIRTIAYINIDGGQLTAYPSREAYMARDNDTAFFLDIEPKKASQLAGVFKNRYCMIEGKVIHLNERYYEFIKLGKLTEVKILVDTDSPRNDFQSKDIYIDKLKK